MSNRLGGKQGTAYTGTNANQPPNWTFQERDPGIYDSQNVSLGDLWLNKLTKKVWVLVSLAGNSTSRGILADWKEWAGGGDLDTLTGNNTGVVVSGDANRNINIVGDGTSIDITGNAGTNTLTVSADGSVSQSFPTDSGTATPAAGILNILAQNATLGCGATVLFSAPGPSNTVQLNVTDSLGNTIIGEDAGNLTLTSTDCTILGSSSGIALTSSPSNVIIGESSANLLAGGSGLNVILGQGAAPTLVTGSENIIIGTGSASNLSGSESRNVLIGRAGTTGKSGQISIGNTNSVGINNIFIGNDSGNDSHTSILGQNIALGGLSLNTISSGYYNVCIGHSTGASITTSQGNCLYGNGSGVLITGNGNTAYGHETMFSAGGVSGLTSGEFNIALGYTAASAWTGAESFNILIGSESGTAGDSNITRIGSWVGGGANQTKCFIQGIRGIVTDVADAVAVLVDSAGQLGTVSSSLRYKENVEDLPSTLNDLMKLRVTSFDYKNRSSKRKSVGMIAEEVFEVIPDLVVHNQEGEIETIKYQDLCIYLLKAMQEQQAQIEILKSKLQS